MNEPHGIIIFGANGSGKTTLGRELARILDFKHTDIEDYCFEQSEIPYTNRYVILSKSERFAIIKYFIKSILLMYRRKVLFISRYLTLMTKPSVPLRISRISPIYAYPYTRIFTAPIYGI